jgi:Mrp family chromosome partitioning ATPase
VLLVDADLRRPCVAANLALGEDGEPGLTGAVLDEQLNLGMVVRPTPFHLDVLPAGSPPANAYEVLESPRVTQLLDEARASYDYVVLDSPPLLLVPDCRLMSQWVDRFLLVVAAHQTPRKLLAEALSAMDPPKVLGIVFNRDDRPLSGYYKQYYGSYYHERSAGKGRSRRWWPWAGRGRGRRPSWR